MTHSDTSPNPHAPDDPSPEARAAPDGPPPETRAAPDGPPPETRAAPDDSPLETFAAPDGPVTTASPEPIAALARARTLTAITLAGAAPVAVAPVDAVAPVGRPEDALDSGAVTTDFAPPEVPFSQDTGSVLDEPEGGTKEEPSVGAPFVAFYEHYGPVLCGRPITEAVTANGVQIQFFEHLALETTPEGGVRPKKLGAMWIDQVGSAVQGPPTELSIRDVAMGLRRHPERAYEQRTLSKIRHLVLHHTGVPEDISPERIAVEHVDANGWPGIGYHYIVDSRGAIYQTQDLTTVTYHAREFNPVSVGIALSGDFSSEIPPDRQLEAVAYLLAQLVADLGLGTSAIRGHRELVTTGCPGDTFKVLWKPRLIRLVERRLIQAASVAELGQ